MSLDIKSVLETYQLGHLELDREKALEKNCREKFSNGKNDFFNLLPADETAAFGARANPMQRASRI